MNESGKSCERRNSAHREADTYAMHVFYAHLFFHRTRVQMGERAHRVTMREEIIAQFTERALIIIARSNNYYKYRVC